MLRPAMLAGAIPAGVPELPADLKGDGGLAGAGRHREEQAALPLEDGLDRAVDGDLLVVALALADGVIARREQALGALCVIVRPAAGSAARGHPASG